MVLGVFGAESKKKDARKAPCYDEYAVTSGVEFDQGLLVLPVAAEPAPGERCVAVIRVHAPYTMRQVEFGAVKKGTPPVVPGPADGPNDILLGGAVSAPLPRLNSELSSYDWTVGGAYAYVRPVHLPLAVSGLPIGDFPFDTPPQVNPDLLEFQKPQIDFKNPYWVWLDPTVLPGACFDPSLVKG